MLDRALHRSAYIKRVNLTEPKVKQNFGVISSSHSAFEDGCGFGLVLVEVRPSFNKFLFHSSCISFIAERVFPVFPLKSETVIVIVLGNNKSGNVINDPRYGFPSPTIKKDAIFFLQRILGFRINERDSLFEILQVHVQLLHADCFAENMVLILAVFRSINSTFTSYWKKSKC